MGEEIIDAEKADRLSDPKRKRLRGSTALERALNNARNATGKTDEKAWRKTFGPKPALKVISATDDNAASPAPGTTSFPGYVPAGRYYRPPGNTQPYTIYPKRDINAEVKAQVNPPATGEEGPGYADALLARHNALAAQRDRAAAGITIDPMAPTPPRTLTKAESDAVFGMTPQDAQDDGATKAFADSGTNVQTQYGEVSSTRKPAPPDWQEQIVKKYPAIGVAGSPENKAFVASFSKHGAWERGMKEADAIMSPTIKAQATAATAKPPKKIDASSRMKGFDYLS